MSNLAKAALSDPDPTVARSCVNLADLYREWKRDDGREKILREVLPGRVSILRDRGVRGRR